MPSNKYVLILIAGLLAMLPAMDAGAGKWDGAARAAFPLGLALVAAIAVAVIVSAARKVDPVPKPVLRRLLPPLATVVILLVAGAMWLLWLQQRNRLSDTLAFQIASVSREFQVDLDNQTAGLTATVQPIAADVSVQTALDTGDSASLQREWAPVFTMLRQKNKITHFCFLDKDRNCLMRLQNPQKRGDRIDRFTAMEAARTGNTASGIELGSGGILTLRVVQPVFADDTLVGYVELGKEIDDVLQSRRDRAGLELAVTINTQFLNRPQWEEGIRVLEEKTGWAHLPHNTMVYTSQQNLPEALIAWAGQASDQHIHGETDREVSDDGKCWRVAAVPLRDASGTDVGDLLLMRDVTADKASFARLMIAGGTVGGFMLAFLLSFIGILLRRTDAGIRAQQRALQESEQSYRDQFARNSAIMLLIEPCNSAILDANEAAVDFYGYPRERLLAMSISDLDTMPAEEVRRAIATACPERGSRIQCQHRLADGSVRDLQASASRIRFGGRIVLHAIVQDITAQKRAEAELRDRSELLTAINAELEAGQTMLLAQTREMRALLDGMPGHSYLKARDGRYLAANQMFCQALGRTEESIIGATDLELFPPEVAHKRLADDQQVFSAAVPILETEDLLIRGHQQEWMLTRKIPVHAPDGTAHRLIGVSIDITSRKAMEEELRTAARTDKLTGLPNRTLLCDRLQQAVLRGKCVPDYHFAVLFLDFDRFKTINDSFGHDVGDMLLQEIARRLTATVRAGNSLSQDARGHITARLGGDEFIVLLDGIAGPQDAITVAYRLLEAFAEPYHLGEHKIHSTASIGIVPGNMAADTAADVLRDADTAMYEAKQAGKARYVVFDVSMRQRVQLRLDLENDLRKALDAGQLFLTYEPVVSLQTGAIASCEALPCWRHPQHGLIPAERFIPIAEDAGLILPIAEWTLRQACEQFVRWRGRMGDAAPLSVSVNLSRCQLAMPDLPGTIGRIVAETGIRPACLHLEVTESAVMKNAAVAGPMLHAIRALDVRLDMDDFGTGYSSLASLHELPLDVLKIDRSFVAGIHRGRDFAALVQAVAQLARNLDIRVVGEGIETLEQVLTLQSMDCEFGQGRFFGEPLTAEQVDQFHIHPYTLPGQAA